MSHAVLFAAAVLATSLAMLSAGLYRHIRRRLPPQPALRHRARRDPYAPLHTGDLPPGRLRRSRYEPPSDVEVIIDRYLREQERNGTRP